MPNCLITAKRDIAGTMALRRLRVEVRKDRTVQLCITYGKRDLDQKIITEMTQEQQTTGGTWLNFDLFGLLC